jgi:ATP-dependent RNA helicase SUPV3L1/SUV3
MLKTTASSFTIHLHVLLSFSVWTGKTYAALERLKQAKKGMYLGPLRLLAAEVYEQLTMAGIYCNLYTGQECREIPFATHVRLYWKCFYCFTSSRSLLFSLMRLLFLKPTQGAATVEMASLADNFDIVVIDEIQMIDGK